MIGTSVTLLPGHPVSLELEQERLCMRHTLRLMIPCTHELVE